MEAAWYSDLAQWLLELVYDATQDLFALLLQALAAVLGAIPVPDWLTTADPFAGLDPGVVFFADAFEIPAGIVIILGAYVIRFIIRRIPVIG